MEIPYIEEVKEKNFRSFKIIRGNDSKEKFIWGTLYRGELVHRTYYEEVLLLQLGGKQS